MLLVVVMKLTSTCILTVVSYITNGLSGDLVTGDITLATVHLIYYSLKFPVTPPTDVNKTWEITFTTEDVKIKCNTLQVLHFIFNNTHR